MKLKKLISLLLALLCIGGAAQAITLNKEMNAATMGGDLSETYVQLPRKHVALFGHMTEEAWAAERERIAARLPELTPAQFYYELRHMLAMVRDAHTTVHFVVGQSEYLRALPFAIGCFAGEWRVIALAEEHAQYLGWQLTAINGVPMDEVFARAKTIISHENDSWARSQLSDTIAFLDALQYLGIADMDASGVTLHVCRDGEQALLEIGAQDNGAGTVSFVPEKASETMYISVNYTSFPLDDTTLYVQYNKCAEDPQLPISEFTQTALEWMTDAGCDRLVFDLRNNGGGDSRVIEPFLLAMQEYQQAHGLEVYALIGPGTFSSGTMAMMSAKWWLSATLVGETTGGAMVCCGNVKNFSLPNMPLIVQYSTTEFEFIDGYPWGEGMTPDVTVEMTFDEYRAGRDPAVEWAMAQ